MLPDPCPACGERVQPVQEMLENLTMRSKCPRCEAPVDLIKAVLENAGAGEPRPAEPARPQREHPALVRAAQRAPTTTMTTLELMKMQAEELRARIPTPEQLRAMKAALKALDLAIAAAGKTEST
jgi:hypothetical protein